MYQRKVFERYLTVTEERQLLRTVAKPQDLLSRRDSAWMRLLRHTGIRVGALAGLTVLDARQALKQGRIYSRPEISKGEQGYDVYLNRKAREGLTDLLRVRREQGHPDNPDAPLVMSRNHAGMSVRSFQARMRMWVRDAGLDVSASPHWWRHTLSKRILATSTARDPLGIVQAALGHRSRTSTSVYTMPDREDVAQAMEEAS